MSGGRETGGVAEGVAVDLIGDADVLVVDLLAVADLEGEAADLLAAADFEGEGAVCIVLATADLEDEEVVCLLGVDLDDEEVDGFALRAVAGFAAGFFAGVDCNKHERVNDEANPKTYSLGLR